MAEYVLVVVTAEGCGACNKLKANWGAVKSSILSNYPGIEIKEINVPGLKAPLPREYAFLAKWVGWYPTFVLVKRSEWVRGSAGNPSVFNSNGSYDSVTGKVALTGGSSPSYANISEWLKK